MKITYKTNNYLVIDDFLSTNAWDCVQDQLECESYDQVKLGDDKVYKLNSGTIYKSHNKYWSSKKPWKNNYQPFLEELLQVLTDKPHFLPNYDDISMMVHAYQQGSELSWHKDSGVLGAYTFYAHKNWSHLWGGNLMVASEKTQWDDIRVTEKPLPNTDLKDSFGKLYNAKGISFDHSLEQKVLQQPGHGEFIMPLPNRLVLMSNQVFHKVERIDLAAGHNYRVSLTGFFI